MPYELNAILLLSSIICYDLEPQSCIFPILQKFHCSLMRIFNHPFKINTMLLEGLYIFAKNLETFNSKDCNALFLACIDKLHCISRPQQKDSTSDESKVFEMLFNLR